MFEEITMQEAIEGSKRTDEIIYMLHRVCEDTTVSELSSSAGFVRIVPEEAVEPDDVPQKPMMSFAEMLGEESSPVEDAELNEPDPPPQKKAKKRKVLDWGKIQALHKAGWSHAKIADEMGCTVSTVATGLSKLRKEAGNGKKQGNKADAGTEKADDGSRSGGEELAGSLGE